MIRLASRYGLSACMLAIALLAGCQTPPPPPPAPPPLTGTAFSAPATPAFTVAVVYAPAGPTWTYTVTSATGSRIVSIGIIAPLALEKCTLSAPLVPAAAGGAAARWKTDTVNLFGRAVPTGFSDPVGLVSATFSITCDAKNGPIYLLITDAAGTPTLVMTRPPAAAIIGPVAGPV